ncbi:MAG: glycosyltransferase [Desulfovibrionaceae bacterium]
MRILSVNSCLDEAFQQGGHEVLSVSLPGGTHALGQVAGVSNFCPDMLFQQEALGKPVVLTDLSFFVCVKAFWSIDTHINLYWHRYYGRLFDIFFTPHKTVCAEAPAHWQHPNVCRLAYAGTQRPWKAHAARADALNFVGRMTSQRPFRKHFMDFFHQRYGLQARENISYASMLDLYADTRVLPNECMALETNFRLLEGASCGCCVISPDIGEDQEALLTPGREVLVYADALECMELTDFCLRKPRMAEAIGKLAQQRIQAEHLPVHRAAQVLQAVRAAPAVALRGVSAREALWCSVAELHLSGEFTALEGQFLWEGAFPDTVSVLALRVRWAERQADFATDTSACLGLLQKAEGVFSRACAQAIPAAQFVPLLEAAATISLVALKRGDIAIALRMGEALGVQLGNFFPVGPGDSCDMALGVRLALQWAAALYPAAGHWYQALAMLAFASRQDAESSAWARQWVEIGPAMRRFPLLALSGWARLSLNAGDSPDLLATYVAQNIRCFRVREALHEVRALVEVWGGSPQESVFWQHLQAQCKNISKLDESLQPFAV